MLHQAESMTAWGFILKLKLRFKNQTLQRTVTKLQNEEKNFKALEMNELMMSEICYNYMEAK